MCGIISIKGKNINQEVIHGLERLEYRGYDSCGIAYKSDKIEVYKTEGYISNLKAILPDSDSDISIGHTRWATHGGANAINSHPHLSSDKNFAVVHNGILENYKDLKAKYLSHIDFMSETDTEVIPNLISYFYDQSTSIFEAFKKAISLLKGSYAIAMINTFDDCIYFARHSSPAVLSRSGENLIISSDINGLKDKSQVYYLPDDTIGYIDDDFYIYDKNYSSLDIKYEDYSSTETQITNSNYPHYMLKEIHEIPVAIESTFEYLKDFELRLPRVIKNVLFIACGTSYHSSLIGKKYIEKFSQIPADCEIASEFIYNDYLPRENTLAIFISQSGETADTLKSLKKAKELGMYTLAITNVENSSITHLADSTILMKAGAEICVASTKAYTTQLFVLLMLSNYLKNLNTLSTTEELVTLRYNDIINYLPITEKEISELYNINIDAIDLSISELAETLHASKQLLLIGKDYDFITAKEGSLKIKEISYIFTDAYPCGELKHGTLSLIDDSSFVFAIITEEEMLEKSKNAIHEITARKGRVIVITGLEEEFSDAYKVIRIPALNKYLMPILSIIPIDLLAYRITTRLGYNPDKPRNLAKSVTVE